MLVAGLGSGASAVTGGRSIDPESAPWSVFVENASQPHLDVECTGSIIDPTHVVTAAHCLYTENGELVSPAQVSIEAGVSNYMRAPGPAAQHRTVASFRVHPRYAWSGGPEMDDVAVLQLSSPLNLAGHDVHAVALPAAGSAFPAGAPARLAGFGQEAAGRDASGELTEMKARVEEQGDCGQATASGFFSANAIIFCAAAPSSATCLGDSGGGLVTGQSEPTLIGVASGAASACKPGGETVYAYTGAPEIGRFLRGDDTPPFAARQTSSGFVHLRYPEPLRVGETVSCKAAGWNGPVSLAYSFVTTTDRVLQHGPETSYVLSPAAAGTQIYCVAAATNAGGTTLVRTSPTITVG